MRPYAPSDLKNILKIENLSFSSDEAFSKKTFEHFFKLCPDGFLVAQVEQKTVGYVIGCTEGGIGVIGSLAVAPQFRRQGVGEKLLNFTLKSFRKKGIDAVELCVGVKNLAAVKFYQKFGFEILKTVKNYYRSGEDAYLMRKTLKKEGIK